MSLIEESRAPFALSAAARISLATSKERLLGFLGKRKQQVTSSYLSNNSLRVGGSHLAVKSKRLRKQVASAATGLCWAGRPAHHCTSLEGDGAFGAELCDRGQLHARGEEGTDLHCLVGVFIPKRPLHFPA